MHSQPRSCIGSPRWTSSQSSTPRSPSRATMRLPVRKSPCTRPSAEGGGRCAASHRRPISSAGRGSAKSSYSPVTWLVTEQDEATRIGLAGDLQRHGGCPGHHDLPVRPAHTVHRGRPAGGGAPVAARPARQARQRRGRPLLPGRQHLLGRPADRRRHRHRAAGPVRAPRPSARQAGGGRHGPEVSDQAPPAGRPAATLPRSRRRPARSPRPPRPHLPPDPSDVTGGASRRQSPYEPA